jgi:hypothetical protein
VRKVADIVSRNFGELIEEPVGSNKVYTGTEQPILEDLGEGEFILDAVKNRPLIKVGGELKQMKVDGDGFVFYDTPSGGSMGQSLISTFEQLSQAVDTNKTYYYGFYINAARINDVGLRPAISKLGNVLKKISFDIITAFDGNFTFEWNMIFGGIQILTDGIDFNNWFKTI